MTSVDMVYHHDFHPPDEVRVFAVPASAIRLRDDATLVYDVLIDDLVLRHYAFTDRWFAVNCTLDRRGRFVTETGLIDWCFNCDITTPLFGVGSNVYTVDLALDVLVGPDGHTHRVQDEDDFTCAVENRWLSVEEQVGARRGLEGLLRIIEGAGLVAYLERAFPFGAISDPVAPPPMTTLHAAEVPLVHRSIRGAYVGRKLT